MSRETTVAPVNSILFISDLDGVEVPAIERGASIWKTDTCIAFATYPEQDGDTRLILGSIDEVNPGRAADLDTTIDTPTRRLVVETAVRETIFDLAVASSKTRVALWLSHPRWPERVIIGVG